MAIYIFPMPCEIASVVLPPRSDITTQSPPWKWHYHRMLQRIIAALQKFLPFVEDHALTADRGGLRHCDISSEILPKIGYCLNKLTSFSLSWFFDLYGNANVILAKKDRSGSIRGLTRSESKYSKSSSNKFFTPAVKNP